MKTVHDLVAGVADDIENLVVDVRCYGTLGDLHAAYRLLQHQVRLHVALALLNRTTDAQEVAGLGKKQALYESLRRIRPAGSRRMPSFKSWSAQFGLPAGEPHVDHLWEWPGATLPPADWDPLTKVQILAARCHQVTQAAELGKLTFGVHNDLDELCELTLISEWAGQVQLEPRATRPPPPSEVAAWLRAAEDAWLLDKAKASRRRLSRCSHASCNRLVRRAKRPLCAMHEVSEPLQAEGGG